MFKVFPVLVTENQMQTPKPDKDYSNTIQGIGLNKYFPNFLNKNQFEEYRRWQREDLSYRSMVGLILVLGIPNMFTRYNWQFFGTSDQNYFAFAAQLILFPINLMLCVHLTAYYYWKKLPRDGENVSCMNKWVLSQVLTVSDFLMTKGRCEEALLFLVTLVDILIFISRVFAGPCPRERENSIWLSQSCNPVANCSSFPQDAMLMLFMPPMILHSVWRGVQFLSVVSAYFAGMLTLVYAICTVEGGYLQMYTILYSFSFVIIAYEMERFMRISFLNNVSLLAEQNDRINRLEAKQMRAILGNMAHDLKTPLHSIIAEIDYLRNITCDFERNTSLPRDSTENVPVTYFKESASLYDHLDGMTKFLLMSINRAQDFVKSSSGVGLKTSLENVNIIDCLTSVKKMMDSQINGRLITIIEPQEAFYPNIFTDRQFLMDNILCLVSNACKYSDFGSSVEVRFSLVDEYASSTIVTTKSVKISFTDNGIGIPQEMKSSLFQPFKQAQRRTGGTGLGLYSLRMRMEALGGTYAVLDRDDGQQGSIFWFSFPYIPEILSISDSIPCTGEPEPTKNTVSKLRILLCDDSASILKVTSRFLEQNGHKVVSVENGSQAITALNLPNSNFDLLITDLQMPVMDGFESVRRIRAMEQKRDIESNSKYLFIIGMSANSDEETKKEVIEVGMDAFCVKPFNYKSLEKVFIELNL